MARPDPRREHYRDLYRGPERDGRPLGLVHGNCQAEALRVLLAGSPSFPWQLVRVPPVHELERADLGAYDELLGSASLLLSQPVRDGYRDLPLGTDEIAARMPPGGRVVRWPVLRYSGLHPWQAIVRVPDGAEPPVVPYHDLRLLTGLEPVEPDLPAARGASVAELLRREDRDTDVGVSDLLVGLGAAAAHTINHPGNEVLLALAHRAQDLLDVPADAADPGRELLGGTRAPLEPAVLDALGLTGAREHWLVDGRPVPADEVATAHRAFYAARPDVVAAGLERHRDLLPLLGLEAAVPLSA